MDTLLDVLGGFTSSANREAIRYHNGYRTWKLTYGQLYRRICGFAHYLDKKGVRRGDRLLLWGENRPEWAVVFWACVARGVEVVPIDFHSSFELAARIQGDVKARLIVVGDEPAREAAGLLGRLDGEVISFHDMAAVPDNSALSPVPVGRDDVVEIIYTSGTTAEPKGVVHRHRNLCANLSPIGREIDRFRTLARPFQPIRLLDSLPLSHMFGQLAGLFIPPMLGGAVVFSDDYSPGGLIDTVRRERVSAFISVPRLLQNVRNEMERRFDLGGRRPKRRGWLGAAERWWLFRDVHRCLGLKFWSVVVGGARLEAELEDFWKRVGIAVVQGYGLTESSPIVAVNHPFDSRRGSIGKAVEGQEVKLAPDGEILVRGESVTGEYVGATSESATWVEQGWLHTGDVGAIDAEGRLYFKGRKKDTIVTAEGLNVFPQDVESVLHTLPEVKESVVVGQKHNGDESIHAVLILRQGAGAPDSVIREANSRLEAHQRIQSWSLWPGEDFPRTPSTQKIKRGEVARSLDAAGNGDAAVARPAARGVKGALAEATGRDPAGLDAGTRLEEDLALTSLQRMDLLARLENEFAVELDEEEFARLGTVGELEEALNQVRRVADRHEEPHAAVAARSLEGVAADQGGQASGGKLAPEVIVRPTPSPTRVAVLPRWSRSLPVRSARALLLNVFMLPLMRQMIKLRVEGLEKLAGAEPPLLFASNHLSHLDTACIAAALPHRWRRKLAPAMSQDYFRAYLEPRDEPWRERWEMAAQFYLACALFNAYPLPQKMGGTRRALKYTGELIDAGFCPLVYPEGERSLTGQMQPFKTGIGLMAIRLKVSIVPVFISGTYEIQSVHDEWPKPGEAIVRFGKPLELDSSQTYDEAASRIEDAVRALTVA